MQLPNYLNEYILLDVELQVYEEKKWLALRSVLLALIPTAFSSVSLHKRRKMGPYTGR